MGSKQNLKEAKSITKKYEKMDFQQEKKELGKRKMKIRKNSKEKKELEAKAAAALKVEQEKEAEERFRFNALIERRIRRI